MPEKFLVGWRCQKCGSAMVGYLSTGESAVRVCQASARKGRKYYPLWVHKDGEKIPYICKFAMEVIHDERPPKLNVLVMERDPPLTEVERMETDRRRIK